ncbi:MAG: four-carbon acid sugar kinase family protein [Desulfofustis sp.]|nr:four-carbon acid sugar kinase family protein [Desulfofustis sp.]
MKQLLLAFYGDDFTGSADAMEALTLSGVSTALFLGQPDPDKLPERLHGIQAVGVSGISRSMTPDQMDEELPQQFALLSSLGAPIIHYKVCATFDSSPTVGNIGHAAEIAFRVINPALAIIAQGVPVLGRYVVFGNHFTTYAGETYRLDRHPMMSRHPITPMDEGDLRLHFAKQSNRAVKLIDLLQLSEPFTALSRRVDRCLDDGAEILLFDTLEDKHLQVIGRLVDERSRNGTVFAIGSSGFEYAMAMHWQATGLISKPAPIPPVGPVEQLLVVSGSAAAKTAEQIEFALAHGFAGLRLNSALLVDDQTASQERRRVVREGLDSIRAGKSIILYSTIGPDDPAIAATRNRLKELGIDKGEAGQRLGRQQGLILRDLLEETGLKRVCVAGGDTCSYTLRQLDIHSLELLMPITPAAPLCRAFSDHPPFEGLQVASKGGQIGAPGYFLEVLNGKRDTL